MTKVGIELLGQLKIENEALVADQETIVAGVVSHPRFLNKPLATLSGKISRHSLT